MRNFKLILYFLLLSNGYSDYSPNNDSNNEDDNNTFSVGKNLVSIIDAAFQNTFRVSSKKTPQKDPNQWEGSGIIDLANGSYSSLLQKQSTGAIQKANGLALIDDDLRRRLHFSKSSPSSTDYSDLG